MRGPLIYIAFMGPISRVRSCTLMPIWSATVWAV